MAVTDAELRYWEIRCSYCEAPLRRDGGCCMWYGEPHDLPYGERDRPTGREVNPT